MRVLSELEVMSDRQAAKSAKFANGDFGARASSAR